MQDESEHVETVLLYQQAMRSEMNARIALGIIQEKQDDERFANDPSTAATGFLAIREHTSAHTFGASVKGTYCTP